MNDSTPMRRPFRFVGIVIVGLAVAYSLLYAWKARSKIEELDMLGMSLMVEAKESSREVERMRVQLDALQTQVESLQSRVNQLESN